eukprot:Hpha_TRINITY_DN16943_c3_g8::TRINITY_DN16943_c3_g8_i2::g.51730::m.51730
MGGEDKDPSIFGCSRRGECDAVVAFLKKDPGMANDFSPEGFTPLHLAAEHKHVNLVRRLVALGSDVNVRATANGSSSRGYTPAHLAARNGDIDVLTILVEHGANLKKSGHDGWTAMHCACFAGKHDCIKWMLEKKADFDSRNEHGITPVCFAANHGRPEAVRNLIKAGANLNNIDNQGDSLMHHAMHVQMFKIFEKDYHFPEIQIDVATLLAIAGAPLHHKNKDGFEPMHFCEDAFGGREFIRFITLLHMNAEKIRKAEGDIASQWNFMTILSIKNRKVWEGADIDPQQAADIIDSVHKFEAERKRKSEKPKRASNDEWMAPGEKKKEKVYDDDSDSDSDACPQKGQEQKGKEGKETAAQLKARGVDPSNGMCPFFSEDANCDGAEQLKAAGKDPSGGLCPYFQTDKKEGETAAPVPAPAGAEDEDDLPDVFPDYTDSYTTAVPASAPAASQPAASQPAASQPAVSQPDLRHASPQHAPSQPVASQPAGSASATATTVDTAAATAGNTAPLPQQHIPPYPYYWPAPTLPVAQAPPAEVLAKPAPPDFGWEWAYENRTAILCCIICFLLGMWWERRIA